MRLEINIDIMEALIMNELSYIEDKNLLAYCVANRDYSIINKKINECKNELTYFNYYNESIIGYKIDRIKQLTNIYGYNVYAVKFYFTNITHEFDDYCDKNIGEMILKLKKDLGNLNGYIIIKVPSSNIMLINQLNKMNINFLFTGGTVCYYIREFNDKNFGNDGLNIKIASPMDKKSYRNELIKLSEASFQNYFGQYHISYVTREKAPMIYKNWVEEYINSDGNNLIIAQIENEVVGFLAIDETDYTIESVLGGISNNFMNKKIYERMLRFETKYTLNKNKISTISTQFDNFFVQRSWVNIGYKPYYSFYLYHVNSINSNII